MYTHIDQVPARRQWEASSAPWQHLNCNPTCVCFVADFYRDATFPIEATCDLGAVCNDGVGGTSAEEAAVMLNKRGVPCTVQRQTPAVLAAQVATRPVIAGLNMAAVPAATRGHSFQGVHAVVLRKRATVGGVTGYMVMDPNFGYGQTVDVTNGNRFYADAIVNGARALSGAWRATIVPNSPKAGVSDMAVQAPELVFFTAAGKPVAAPTWHPVALAAGTHRGYHLDGTGKDFVIPAGGSSAGARGRASITGRPDAPVGSPFLTMMNGIFATGAPWYLHEDGVKVKAVPEPIIVADPAAIKKAQNLAASDIVAATDKYAKEKYP